jgi:hypothetical protein
MVQATVDNSPVSITLASGESTTVPSGETWKVMIKAFGGGHNGRINGKLIVNGDSNGSAEPFETVLVGGDTVEYRSSTTSHGLHIGGFVVN